MEIVFSDSACASLKLAQHYGEGCYIGGAVSVIVSHTDGSAPTAEEIEQARQEAEEQERVHWETAVPMGGNPQDVYCFSLALSVGDISEVLPGPKRLEALRTLFCYDDPEISRYIEQCVTSAAETLQLVRDRLTKGEKIRIWHSRNADERCTVYWMMAQLEGVADDCDLLYEVQLPYWEQPEEDCIRWSAWGDIAPHRWGTFAKKYERPISARQRKRYAEKWRILQTENAPLRIAKDNEMVGVSADFYDAMIREIIAEQEEEFFAAKVVGSAILASDRQIGDGFVSDRLDTMIAAGELEEITPPCKDHPRYHRMLKKVKK